MTLIELLIVISIVGLLVSLVAPLGTRQLDRARAQGEWLTLRRQVESLAFASYARGRDTTIEFSASRLNWQCSTGESGEIEFQFLRFPDKKSVLIDSHGVASEGQVTVDVSRVKKDLRFNRWFER